MAKKPLAEMKEWKALSRHFRGMKDAVLKELFDGDHDRVEKFSIAEGDIYFDYSKNRVNEDTLGKLDPGFSADLKHDVSTTSLIQYYRNRL
jgi:hypothetical protein